MTPQYESHYPQFYYRNHENILFLFSITFFLIQNAFAQKVILKTSGILVDSYFGLDVGVIMKINKHIIKCNRQKKITSDGQP